MNTKHTPGPLEISDGPHGYHIDKRDPEMPARSIGIAWTKGDAQLFAQAYELLASLKLMTHAYVKCVRDGWTSDPEEHEVVKRARAAIKMAESND